MKTYFSLQYQRMLRGIKAAGMPPMLAVLLAVILFPALSVYLFKRFTWAAWCYPVIPVMLVYPLGYQQRNGFLQTLFPEAACRQLRLTENLLVSAPFVLFLLAWQQWLSAAVTLVAGILLSFYNKAGKAGFVIPTPFSKKPFEFAVGFRKTFLLTAAAYLLTAIALYVQNFNLGIFGLAATLLLCMNYYAMPEQEFYVWIYALPPRQFLLLKLTTAVKQALLLALPPAVALCCFYPAKAYIVVLIVIAGLLNIALSVTGKYSRYPQQPGLSLALCMAMGLVFAPALLLLIPMFFKQSVKQLTPYL